jgi:hypothetical protein
MLCVHGARVRLCQTGAGEGACICALVVARSGPGPGGAGQESAHVGQQAVGIRHY